jgi:hypothetical protein
VKIKYEKVELSPARERSGLSTAILKCPVGQSFIWDFPNKVTSTAHNTAKYHGISVAVRKVEGNTYRIFRIK